MKMKIVFMGTPDFAVKALEALAARHEVVCVYTREPQEAGRGKKLTIILSRKGTLTALCNATQRELREGHNLEKMYISGEFEKYE